MRPSLSFHQQILKPVCVASACLIPAGTSVSPLPEHVAHMLSCPCSNASQLSKSHVQHVAGSRNPRFFC